MNWVNPTTKKNIDELKTATRSPHIVWTNPPPENSYARKTFPARYKKPRGIDDIDPSTFTIGAAVLAALPLMLASDKGMYSFNPLEPFYGEDSEAPIREGTVLIYSGPVYETERCITNGKVLDASVVKHTFITPLGRCIIHDFSLIRME